MIGQTGGTYVSRPSFRVLSISVILETSITLYPVRRYNASFEKSPDKATCLLRVIWENIFVTSPLSTPYIAKGRLNREYPNDSSLSSSALEPPPATIILLATPEVSWGRQGGKV